MLYIKVSVQEQQKSTKSSEVCRERKNVEKSRRQTIKTGTSKDTDAPSIMNGNAEVIIVRFRNHFLIGTRGFVMRNFSIENFQKCGDKKKIRNPKISRKAIFKIKFNSQALFKRSGILGSRFVK